MITQSFVKDLLDYDDGFLLWKKTTRHTKAGEIAGSKRQISQISISKKKYLVHRVIFLWHHGYLPNLIDHKDRNTQNNKIENLREANKSQNSINSKIHKTNKSGYRGVSWHKVKSKWQASIKINKRRIPLGFYDDPLVASNAYQTAALKHFKEFCPT